MQQMVVFAFGCKADIGQIAQSDANDPKPTSPVKNLSIAKVDP
jgi:hypothetical protein